MTTTDDVASLADLLTTIFADSGAVEPGGQLTYNWSVNNSGPAASTNTVLTGALDASVTFVSAQVDSPATGQCGRAGRMITCTFGTLELGDTVGGEIVVEVRDTASADIRFAAAAGADQRDRTPADNNESVTTALDAAPRRITDLRATAGSAHVDVMWSAPGDNGSPITSYELERKESGGSYALVTPGPGVAATTYQDSQVSAGTTYTYQLRAVNADGDGEWSDEATATVRETPPPPPPPPPDRPPVFADGPRTDRSIAENTSPGENVGAPVTATGSGILAYRLGGADAGSFGIVEATGQIQVGDGTILDYEAEKNTYGVEVTATDPSGATARITVTIAVTNLDEAGTVTLSAEEPAVGAEVTATLGDPDGSVTDVTWQWAKSADMDSWMDISGATSMSYTPASMDAGYHLRATATYTDLLDSGRTARAVSDHAVTDVDPLFARYDANGNDMIDKAEVIQAINDYLFGEGDEAISKAEVIELINLYLFG